MIEPIRLAFDVACPPAEAWTAWTERIGQWWPADHTVSAEPELEVTLESGVGGRIYERTAGGDEHDWGEVTVWEPPTRLAYLWHLKRDRADATEVEIRFTGLGADSTRVEIEHRGWERLGADGVSWRDRNFGGWSTLLPHYIAAVGGGSTPSTNQAPEGGSDR
ncbi:MAG: SRPBCC family protein [Candidatus Limnocylindria bacterium]